MSVDKTLTDKAQTSKNAYHSTTTTLTLKLGVLVVELLGNVDSVVHFIRRVPVLHSRAFRITLLRHQLRL